ncbi:MAG TPA: hypothetical protein VFN66_07580 [Burkholderiales bacterium]|nr:hypothetical protein [Burkholderiales bacterium]
MSKKIKIKWLPLPDEHDYPAAASYLSLIYEPDAVAGIMQKMQQASMHSFKAKDIFRASGLSLLGISNTEVETDRKKIRHGIALSPLLLVRDTLNGKVVIADGYHRLCAVYEADDKADIPCKIA